MSDSSNLTGKTLGTCVLEKLVGQGGMGAVYLARQARPSRYVAVKVLLPTLNRNSGVYQEFLSRFRREADVIARLEHVNIMPIYEYGEQDGLAYLVMPYLAGGTIRDILAQRGSLSLAETTVYIQQAAAALDYAHGQKVIHRDIKPSNFLLHQDGRLVLADFGIARMMQDTTIDGGPTLTTAGTLLGTPDYMAPEMARGEPIDYRADIYELGIVIFQMLSGEVPFKGNTALMVMAKHLQEPLPSLHETHPSIPLAIDMVLQKAAAKRREDRYTSAGAVAYALQSAITPFDYRAGIPPPPPNFSSQPSIAPALYSTPPSAPPGSLAGIPTTDQAAFAPQTYPPRSPETYPFAPKRTSQPWLIVIALLLIIAVIIGSIFLGMWFKGGSTSFTIPGISPSTTVVIPSPTLSPPQQAQAVVQRLYDDINSKNYQDAYDQWGADYHSKTSYDQFASGFQHTIHDDVSLTDASPLGDGTVQVSLTFRATDDTASGPVTTTYQGYYIVGQENGSWKILRGHLA